MSLTKFTDSTNVIEQLPDTPTLTSAQLKAKFDEVGTKIKSYLNNTLTNEVEQSIAEEKQSLQTIISNLETELTKDINNAVTTENAMISDQYSTLKIYKVGDLCIYNNALYKCISEITVGEGWNSLHWEKTAISKNIQKQLVTGQEMATNEYIDGKQVYVKRFNIGQLPNNSKKNVAHGLTNVTFRKIDGEAHNNILDIHYPLPFTYKFDLGTNFSDAVSIWIYTDRIEIQTYNDKSDFTGFVNLYYTKNN